MSRPTAEVNRLSSFENLPNELLSTICETLDFEDLKNLRSASKTLNGIALHTIKNLHSTRYLDIRLSLTPSDLFAFQKFTEGPLAKDIAALTLVKTSFETFIEDAERTARLATTSPRRLDHERRLYHEANRWGGQPLEKLLPRLGMCCFIGLDPEEIKRSNISIGQSIVWDFEVLGSFIGSFERSLHLQLRSPGHFICNIVADGSEGTEVEVTCTCNQHDFSSNPHACSLGSRAQMEMLQSCFRNIEYNLFRRPIESILFCGTLAYFPDLRRLFQAINPPKVLTLWNCDVGFDMMSKMGAFRSKVDDEPSESTESAIKSFVASLRPNIREFLLLSGAIPSDNDLSALCCLFEALKSCNLAHVEISGFFSEQIGDPGDDDPPLLRAIFGDGVLDEWVGDAWRTTIRQKGMRQTLDDAIDCIKHALPADDAFD